MAKGRRGKKGGQADKQRKAMFANMRSRGVDMGKTPEGMNADLQKSANVFSNTPANLKEWRKPGGSRRMDIEGIDTKPKMVMQITFEDVTPEIKQPRRKYFTMGKAKRLMQDIHPRTVKNMSDDELQKKDVIVSDYIRFMSSDDPYSKSALMDGGYYMGIDHPEATGLAKTDIGMHTNLVYTQTLIDKEKRRRIDAAKKMR